MYIVFDIGGTNTRIAASQDGVAIGKPVIFPTPANNFKKAISEITAAAKKLSQDNPIAAIAGGIAGPLNKEKSIVLAAPNLPGWHDQPLKEQLEKQLKAPVYLENDTAMIGLGEAAQGTGKGKRIVAYITVSTGIGGCRIVDGTITPNALGFEPGHHIIDINGPRCGCGIGGHLEALVSGAAFERTYKKPAADIEDPAIWGKAAYSLAVGLNNVLMFWSPDIIVLGGSLMKRIDIARVRQHVRSLVTIFPDPPPIELSALKDEGGLVGSLVYLKQHA